MDFNQNVVSNKEFETVNSLVDEELVTLTNESKIAVEVLISRYIPLIYLKSKSFHSPYVESDDLVQEGLIGLLNAIKHFNSKRGAMFSTFANVCITNKMKSLLLYNNKVDLPTDNLEQIIDKFGVFESETPESILLYKEYVLELFKKVDSLLSPLEYDVLNLFIKDMKYSDIANRLSITEKAVDNAVQRIRTKLKKFLNL